MGTLTNGMGERKINSDTTNIISNLETTKSIFNLGDILFTLFTLGFTVLIIVLIVSLVRTSNKRKQQLDRIEKKIDNLNQLKK